MHTSGCSVGKELEITRKIHPPLIQQTHRLLKLPLRLPRLRGGRPAPDVPGPAVEAHLAGGGHGVLPGLGVQARGGLEWAATSSGERGARFFLFYI